MGEKEVQDTIGDATDADGNVDLKDKIDDLAKKLADGSELSADEVKKIIKSADANGDGKLDKDEQQKLETEVVSDNKKAVDEKFPDDDGIADGSTASIAVTGKL